MWLLPMKKVTLELAATATAGWHLRLGNCMALRRPRSCCRGDTEPAQLRAQADLVRDHFQQPVCPAHGGWLAESKMQCWMLGNGRRPRRGDLMKRMRTHLDLEEAWLYAETLVKWQLFSGAKNASYNSRSLLLADSWLHHREQCEWEEKFKVPKTCRGNVESSVLYEAGI